jgi:1-acyl-sn-glycerol-3-phosphate acyltransferase
MVWALVRLWGRFFLHWRVEGAGQLPPTGPVLLAINHSSAIDPLLAGVAMQRKVRFMAKEELFRSPLGGWFLRQLGAFPVRRGEGDRQALKQALAVLEQGGVVGIFPEGTRSPDGRLQQAQTGIAFLARRGRAVVVPVAIAGTRNILPKGAWLPRCARVRILVGEPLRPFAGPEGDTGRAGEREGATHDQLRRFADEVMERIGDLMGRASADTPGTV